MSHALADTRRFGVLSQTAGVGRHAMHAGRIVLGCAVGLAALGLVMIYSYASSAPGLVGHPGLDVNGLLSRQVQWIFLAVLAGTAASWVSLTWVRKTATPLLGTVLLLLGIVLVVGHRVNGAQRWIRIFGLTVQPSEVLKIAVLIYLAQRLARREEETRFDLEAPLLSLLAPVGLGVGLVLVQPDLGTSLFVVAEAVVLLALAGIRPTRVLPFAVVVTPLILLYAYTRFAHVRARLSGMNEQVKEGLVAIGSGGLAGMGLGEGAQKLGNVAEMHTDFVFALVGEELGFLGCAAVVVAFMAIAWYGSRLAWFARVLGPFPYYVAAGAAFVIVFQAAINIAVVTHVVPTKGIPLPFVSKGGSNLLVMSVAVGLLVNVARRTAIAAGEDPWAGGRSIRRSRG